MVDILNIDTNYQMLIAEMNGLHNDRKLVLPGVQFFPYAGSGTHRFKQFENCSDF